MTTFEDRLLDQLRLVVAENPAPAPDPVRPRVRHRVAVTGALASIAAATAAAFVAGGGEAAYAVDKQADGGVTVTITSLSDADGLQRKLRAAGIPADVEYLDHAPKCLGAPPVPGAGPQTVRRGREGGGTERVRQVTRGRAAAGDAAPPLTTMSATVRNGGDARFTIDPGTIKPGTRLHITASGGELSTLAMAVGDDELPAPPC